MSRNTVSRLLELPEPPVYERPSSGSKLDPFKASIASMLDENPKVPATVILEHLRRDGYDGGITILKDHLVVVRPLFLQARSYQRTSYLPGEVAHTDWWELPIQIPVGRGVKRKVFGLVTTLPHSAAHACVFTHSKTMADFLPAFCGTLQRLGGAPEKVILDRDTSIVVPKSRPARLHPEVAGLFGAFQLRPVILKPQKPESKGQGERTIGYAEGSFLPLRDFTDLSDIQSQHDSWSSEVAYRRHHRRVGAVVADAWHVERGFLRALPDPLPDTDRHTEVRVTKDGFCRIGDVDYSVPPGLSGRRLQVRVSPTHVVVFCDRTQVAYHRRSYLPADVVLDPAHARALRLARDAKARLIDRDQELPKVDLGRYDTLAEAVTP
jgi:transposase